MNPEVLFQTLASEMSVINAVRSIRHDPAGAQILDVGCGGGGDIYQLLRLGYSPEKITGVEIQTERLEAARSLFPQINWVHGDAAKMIFADNYFDMIFESGMFATLPDDALRLSIASEMVRVCKPEGHLLLVDWRTPKPWDSNYKALTRKELRKLFEARSRRTVLTGVYKGALVPPIGRFLSRHAPSIYFLIAKLFPFLTGQVAYVLKKS